jgi:DNA-binding NtrC family response regulator
MSKLGTILFVDDEIEMGYMITQLFEHRGYKVVAAENADVALNLADGVPLNVMILDVDIAGENGLKLMTFMHRNHPGVPIIIYTGMEHSEETVKQALADGATMYLKKGGSLEELYEAVHKLTTK